MDRIAFKTSRMLDYFSVTELTQRLGYGQSLWHQVAIKELIDNSLDACETSNDNLIEIKVTISENSYSVEDNGSGLPLGVLKDSLDYSVRISTNSQYVSPTRGQLGNALKCIWAIPYVENGNKGICEVTINGNKYKVEVKLDRINQEPIINLVDIGSEDFVKNGTKITIFSNKLEANFYDKIFTIISEFSLINPHVRFILEASDQEAVVYEPLAEVKKILPSDPSPINWFSLDRFSNLLLSHLKNGRDSGKVIGVRDFIGSFARLSSTRIIKEISEKMQFKKGENLEYFVCDNELNENKVKDFYDLLKSYEVSIKPNKLGFSGICRLNNILGVKGKYRRESGEVDGVPYAVEVGFWYDETFFGKDNSLTEIFGINYSLLLKNPYNTYSYNYLLYESLIDTNDPCYLYIHLIYPLVEFSESGKGSINLPFEIKDALEKAIMTVSKEWQRKKKKLKRDEKASIRMIEEIKKAEKKSVTSIIASCYKHMETAYKKASGSNNLPANARQIMYAIRPLVLADCGKFYKQDKTFTQQILPEFLRDNPDLTANWDVVYDARGHIKEPHTNIIVPLGTLAVRNYINRFSNLSVSSEINKIYIGINDITTYGSNSRFKFALFIEKEGFDQQIANYHLAEKYDIAILSTKGMSVTACRQLVDRLSQDGVTILVAHDFDKSGFTIFDTLANNTDRYQYKAKPNVIDIGLRLEDIKEMKLPSEPTVMKQKDDPRGYLRNLGLTENEVNFLVSHKEGNKWYGQRVELNEMDNDTFLDWLERKFKHYQVSKVIPDEKLLMDTYQRLTKRAIIQKEIDKLFENINLSSVPHPPSDLKEKVQEKIDQNPCLSWDQAMLDLIS